MRLPPEAEPIESVGMPDPRDQVEFSFANRPAADGGAAESAGRERQPFLRVWFECSKQYSRGYRTVDAKAYQARCPTCAKTIRFGIGPGGTSERFFRVSCQ